MSINLDKTIGIQGDIRIVKIDKLPEGLKKRKDGTLVYGEATGHKHYLKDGDVYELGSQLFFQTYIPTSIIHEEHNPIPISEPGLYEIKRQREYKSKDMIALVID